MKLEGTLATFPLRELIDMIIYSSVTGVLNIFGSGEAGHLYFRDGTLYHVERGASVGVQALAEVMESAEATFAFVSDTTAEAESLWGSLHQHLLTAERLAGRWRQIRAYIPTLEFVPVLIGARDAVMRRMGPTHAAVIDAINGETTLRELANQLGWAEIDVAEVIAQLSVDGLVDLRPLQTNAVAASNEPIPPTTGRNGNGFFDRMRKRMPPLPNESSAPATTPEPPPTQRPIDTRGQEDLILKLLQS
ncbi:MAG: DUF4388 domain-containing protein [Oscillochloridaceae bacterium umkhey_bin13]